jgi:hypothetical protein
MAKKPNDRFEVRLIKMRQGETLISRMRRVDNAYILKDPMLMIYIPFLDKEGNMSSTEIAFREWIEGAVVREYKIPADSVLLDVECEASIQMTYEKVLMNSDIDEDIEDDEFFDKDYIKDTLDYYNKISKNTGLSGPDEERLDEGEDDLDTDDWGDVPPRFKK